MNKMEKGVIKYGIDFERYKNGQANEIIKLLDKADNEIAKFIRQTNGVYTKARYKEIATKLRDVSRQLKEKVGEEIDVDGIIEYELKKQSKLLGAMKNPIQKGTKMPVQFTYPTTEQIKTAALFKPVTDGFTYDSYLNGIEAGLFNTWDSAVRTAYLTGQTTKQVVSNVIGGVSQIGKLKKNGQIDSFRNSVYGNTRTLLQSFATEARNMIYEENEEYFGDGKYKYEWLSTLDSRTCIACGELDGKLFAELKDAPMIPMHRGCRCILLPYFNIEGEKRASKNGYIDSKINFEDWLKEQDEETQKDVLGTTRYEMFKNGTQMKQFVDNGKILTLEELKAKLGGYVDLN